MGLGRRPPRSEAGALTLPLSLAAMLRAALRPARALPRRHHRGCRRSMSALAPADERLAAVLARMGQQALPPTPQPGGLYVPTVRDGRLLYVSGHAPYDGGGDMITGLCSSEEDVEAASAMRLPDVLLTPRA